MTKQGWIKVHRSVMDSPLYMKEPFCRNMAWIDLLLLVSHKDSFIRVRGIKVSVKAGQIGYSSDTLAVRWKWSRGKVLRFLNELETEQQIVQHRSRLITLITVVNWAKYQSRSTTDSTTDGTTNGQQTIQQTVQQTDTIKNDKKEKNEQKWKEIADPFSSDDFKIAWQDWIEYKMTEHKESYKSSKTEQTAINTFYKNCHHDLATALSTIETSMSNLWSGLFPKPTVPTPPKTAVGEIKATHADVEKGVLVYEDGSTRELNQRTLKDIRDGIIALYHYTKKPGGAK